MALSTELYRFSTNIKTLQTQRVVSFKSRSDVADYCYQDQLFANYRPANPGTLAPIDLSNNIPFSSDFQRRSSFTPEQQRYARLALSYLNAFMRGQALPFRTDKQQNLASRIEEFYLTNEHSFSYEEAITHSYLEGFREFCTKYPKLFPAIRAIYEVGGIKATLKAIHHAKDFADDAQNGLLTDSTLKDYNNLPHTVFVKRHVRVRKAQKEYDFDIHCAGQALATTIVNQSKAAALTITSGNMYHPTDLASDEVSLTRTFQAMIKNVKRKIEASMEEFTS